MTVKELIEILQQCNADHEIQIRALDMTFGVESIGIDLVEKKVDLFGG